MGNSGRPRGRGRTLRVENCPGGWELEAGLVTLGPWLLSREEGGVGLGSEDPQPAPAMQVTGSMIIFAEPLAVRSGAGNCFREPHPSDICVHCPAPD